VNDQWVPGPPPAPPPWVNPLPPSNDWGNAPGCSAPTGPSIVDGIVITGVPATVSSLYWQVVLNDGAAPPNYLINHLDGQGNVIGAPMLISGVDASITFNDPVYLSEDPVQPMQAATKQYVDGHAGGGDVEEAPMDNYPYARYMATWERLPQAYIPEAPNTSQRFGRFNTTWQLDAIQTDAPSDGGTYGRQNGAWNPALALTGGTITGSLTVNQVLTVQGPNSLVLNAPINQQRSIMSMTSNIARWVLTLGDGTSEDASNHGANFTLTAYGVAGAFLGNWLTIARADGSTVFGGGVTMNQGLSVNSLFALQGPGMFYLPGGTAGQMLATDGDGLLSWQTPPGTGGPFLPLIGGTLTGALNLNPPVSGLRYISGQTAGSLRWLINVGDSAAESGSNAGSNFSIQSFADTGSLLSTPLSISRATGMTTVAGRLTGLSDAMFSAGVGAPNFNSMASATGGYAGIPVMFWQSNDGSISYGEVYWDALQGFVMASIAPSWTSSDLALDGGGNFKYEGSGTAIKAGGGSWTAPSDDRIKTVQDDYTSGLDEVLQLRPVVYTYKGNDTPTANFTKRGSVQQHTGAAPYPASAHYNPAKDQTPFVGFIAQELEQIFPGMVRQREGFIDGEKVTDLRDVDVSSLIYALVNAVKTLKAEIDTLRAEAGLG
jgi:hypothetical protein